DQGDVRLDALPGRAQPVRRALQHPGDVPAQRLSRLRRQQDVQSAVALDSRTITFHFSYSFWTKPANCFGEPPTGSAPSRTICASSEGSTSFTALFSSEITGSGVPCGAKK